MALTDVLVCKLVREAHPLRLMLHRLSIHDCVLELLNNSLVDGIALMVCQCLPLERTGLPTKSSTEHALFLSTTGVL
jgi:hypothetical protein